MQFHLFQEPLKNLKKKITKEALLTRKHGYNKAKCRQSSPCLVFLVDSSTSRVGKALTC